LLPLPASFFKVLPFPQKFNRFRFYIHAPWFMKNASASGSSKDQMLPSSLPLPAFFFKVLPLLLSQKFNRFHISGMMACTYTVPVIIIHSFYFYFRKSTFNITAAIHNNKHIIYQPKKKVKTQQMITLKQAKINITTKLHEKEKHCKTYVLLLV